MAQDGYDINPTQMTATSDVAMPQDPEAESSVLSAMMISQDVLQECLIELEPDDFYIPSNRKIYLAMREMFERNMAVDTISLADFLKSQGELERVGGRPYLLDLGNNSLALVGWRRHVEMLRRDSTLRRMISAAAQITALAYDAPEDTKEVVDRAEKMLLDVTNRDVRSSYQPIGSIMSDLFDQLSDMCENQTAELGVKTGFPTIDSGVGKTSFALNLAVNAAFNGASVAFFSLEMSKIEIAQRLLSAQSGVGLQEIRSAHIQNDQWPELIRGTDELSGLDIMIDDTPGTTVTEIRAKARRMLHGKKLGLVVVDYLQLLSPPAGMRRADSRATEVSEMSRGIKIMAKDLECPVIALSQLSRRVTERTGKRPELSDLRESGAIEQDADIVILLDRSMDEEEAARDDRPDMGVTNFIIAKNRSGALGDVPLTFVGNKTKFLEVTTRYDD